MMAEPERRRMTPDEFFEWQAKQDRNYELVDGLPVLPLKAMTGASAAHDTVTVNVIASLHGQLRGGPCRPRTDDIAVRIPSGGVRRPDVLIECGTPDRKRMDAVEPRVVIEVLSPSTMSFDRIRKLEEYKSVTAIRSILLIDTEAPRVTLWRRAEAAWTLENHDGLDATVPLPEIGASLALTEIYEGVTFEA